METIIGTVERITYRNSESGYSILKIKANDYRNILSVIGYIGIVNIGSVLKLNGAWKTDKKFGKQFYINSYEEMLPTTLLGIEKYLSSGLIKGIGKKYAKMIVDKFGENTFTIINNNPNRLLEINGMGTKRVEVIKQSLKEQEGMRDIMLFLQDYGIGVSYATKIYRAYGEESIGIIKENPYRLIEDIKGIGFKTADTIALKLGIDKESYTRCRNGILYTLNELASEGHCYVTLEQILSKATVLLDISDDKLFITVDYMSKQNELYKEGCLNYNGYKRYYLRSLYYSETGVAELLKRIIKTKNTNKIKNYKLTSKISYDENQKQSIMIAVNSKVTVITGGPGTGKTTTILGIIEVFKNNKLNVLLAAPTGRAAKRLSEATGIEAKTIHRLLEYNPQTGYKINESNQLKGDILIVDESSMIDIVLMYNLLKAIRPEMTLILVGDKDQLPSVGAGTVFQDIINSGVVKVIKLEKIYRQASNSDIIKNAHKINKGILLDFKNKHNSDFFFIERTEDTEIIQTIKDLFINRLPKTYNLSPTKDIQILCPMQKGTVGTINLNMVLQEVVHDKTLYLKRGGTTYYLNDKVMQIKNNYNKEVFNGDIGYISNIDLDDLIITVNFDNRLIEYEVYELEELVLAYVVSIHKSQGSEYPVVIIPITQSHSIMLQRNLIYTGVTRAKNLLILIGDKEAIAYAIKNNSVVKRNTWLKERLQLKEGDIE